MKMVKNLNLKTYFRVEYEVPLGPNFKPRHKFLCAFIGKVLKKKIKNLNVDLVRSQV